MVFIKFTKKLKLAPNCLSCAVGNITSLLSIFGLSVQLKCNHESNQLYIISQKRSYVCVGVCIAFIVVVSCSYQTYIIGNNFKNKYDPVTISLVLQNVVYCLRSTFTIICSLRKAQTIRHAYEGPRNMMRAWKINTGLNSLKERDIRSLKIRTVATVIIIGLLLTIYGMYTIFTDLKLETWRIINKMAALLCFLLDFTLILGFIVSTNTTKMLFSNYHSYLKRQLLRRLNFDMQKSRKLSLHTFLILFRRLQQTLQLNVQLWNNFCGLIALIIILSCIAITIASGFIAAITIIAFVNGKPFPIPSEFFGLIFQLYVFLGVQIYIVYDIQRIEYLVSTN